MKQFSFIVFALSAFPVIFAVGFTIDTSSEAPFTGQFESLSAQSTKHMRHVREQLLPIRSSPWFPESGNQSAAGYYLAPPVNDDFINRITLAGDSGAVSNDITDATFETGEPFHFPYGYGRNSIWYTWTAPSSGTFGFDTYNSAIPTFLAIYQGSSLTNLAPIGSNGYPLYSYINAQSGNEYQIAVMGAYEGSTGMAQLRYYPDSIGGSTNFFVVIDTFMLMLPAPDGSIAYTIAKAMVRISSPTNRYGYAVNPGFEYEIYPEGLNIYDRKNTGVVMNAQPDGAGTQYMLLDYDGKQVLLYNQVSQKVLLYRLTRQGLTKVGDVVVPDTMKGTIQGSYIYITQGLSEDIDVIQSITGVQAFDKRLKKLKWQLPYEKGAIYLHGKTGYAYRHATGPYTQEIIRYKKGTEQNRTHIDYSFTGNTQIQTDPYGTILYWYRHGVSPFRTNSPLTCISRKGEEVFSNQTLPNTGDAWAFGGFEKNRLYIIRPDGPDQIVSGYKFSKTITQKGNQPLTGFDEAKLYDKQLTVFRSVGTGTRGFIQYDKNIRKETWNEPASLGGVEYLGKGVFARMQIVPGAGSTNYILRIFNRKKTVATHQVVM